MRGKKIGVQHFSMVLASGGRTVLKQGSRVPIATGSTDKGTGAIQTQATYLDVGLNIDASLDGYADGVRLRTKVEQSSVAEERSGLGLQDPVIRQTQLEGTSDSDAGEADGARIDGCVGQHAASGCGSGAGGRAVGRGLPA